MQFMYSRAGRRFSWSLLFLVPLPLFAQFDVTYPVSRMVLQRDNNNQASMQIAGSYSQPLDRVEAQVVPITAGQGTGTAWTAIQTNPVSGQFTGNLNVLGGWYRLRVRGLKNGQVIGIDSVDRVGVGEVFAIFGHSNAQGSSCDNGDGSGDRCATINGAADDRVVCVGIDPTSPDYQQYERSASSDYLPGLLFAKLNTFTGMSPFNKFAWVWGKLGDLLTARLNVPVLFYGAGFGGTNMQQTYNAAYNIPFSHPFVRYDLRMPYANTRTIMKLYVPSTGIRSFLIVHGENDRYDGSSPQQTHDMMKMYLEKVLAQMRTEFQRPKLAWVIAITSYPNPDPGNAYLFPELRQAEFDVLGETPDTFVGPDLDQIHLPADRPDGIHYSTGAQPTVAGLWNNALTDDFFRNSTPYLPQTQPLAALTCAPNSANQLLLTQAAGFGAYVWSTGATSPTISAGAGTYSARLRRSMAGADSNVIFFPPAVKVPAQVVPSQPTISYGLNSFVCGGESLTLTSSYTTGLNIWSPSNAGTSITVQSAGTYYLKAADPVYGCLSTAASQVLTTGTADLSVVWQASNRTPAVGAPLTYNLTVRNDGPCNVSNVVVQNRLPPNIRFDSSPLFALMASTTDVLNATIPSIPRNTIVSQSYTAHLTAPGQYYNAIEVTGSSSPDPDSQPGSGTADGQDDAATVDVRTRDGDGAGPFVSPNPNQVPLPAVASNQPTPSPTLADLSLSIRSSRRVVAAGQSVDYTLTVSNRGGMDATGISLQDVLPAGLQFVSGSANVSANGSTVTALINQLAAGSDASISFTVLVTGGTTIQTAAQIMAASPGDPDSTPGNGVANGEDDAAGTDLRVTGTGAGARVAAPSAGEPESGGPARPQPIRVSTNRPD